MLDIKEHNKKIKDLSKRAIAGTYPNVRVARAGSTVGLGVGGILIGVGLWGLIQGNTFGLGSLLAGGITGASNLYNLKRIKKH